MILVRRCSIVPIIDVIEGFLVLRALVVAEVTPLASTIEFHVSTLISKPMTLKTSTTDVVHILLFTLFTVDIYVSVIHQNNNKR